MARRLLLASLLALALFAPANAHGAIGGTFLAEPTDDVARAVAFQADGKVVVAGTSSCLDHYCEGVALERFGLDGTLDESFGVGGRVGGVSAGLSQGRAVAIQPDGSILVGGVVAATGASGDGRGGKFAVVRYLSNGTLDPSFGTGGVTRTDFCIEPATSAANALAIQPDGRIVAAGFTRCGGNWALATARYLSDGTPDPAFRAGWLALDAGRKGHEELRGLALQRDGKIMIVGGAFNKLLTFRLTASGHVDTSFGNEGNVETSLSANFDNGRKRPIPATANAVSVDRRGRIVVAGGHDGPTDVGAVLRFLPSGKRDLGFGRGGLVVTPEFDPTGVAVNGCGGIELAGRNSPSRGVDAFGTASLGADGSRKKDWLTIPKGLGREAGATAIVTRRREVVAVGSELNLSGYNVFAAVNFGSARC